MKRALIICAIGAWAIAGASYYKRTGSAAQAIAMMLINGVVCVLLYKLALERNSSDETEPTDSDGSDGTKKE